MNNVSKKFCLVIASAAFIFAGCSKKPKRPDPSSTVLGPGPGGDTLAKTEINPPVDSTAGGLSERPPGVIDKDGMLIGLLGDVYFDFDKSNIKPSERAKIQGAKDYLAKNPGHRILFEGHCDWRGTDEYNLALGDRRAAAAKKYLISLGVAADKVESNSKGSLEASKNATDDVMAKDRKAVIIVLTK